MHSAHVYVLIFTQNFKIQMPWMIVILRYFGTLPYDTKLKLKVILYVAEQDNSAEGYKFIVNESSTCCWRNDRASLLSYEGFHRAVEIKTP